MAETQQPDVQPETQRPDVQRPETQRPEIQPPQIQPPQIQPERQQARHAAPDDALPNRPAAQDGPSRPTKLDRRAWWGALKRTVKEAGDDNLTDWAAALTYYGVLSLFPGLLLIVAGLGLTGRDTTRRVVDSLTEIAPGAVRNVLRGAVQNLQQGGQGTAGVLAIVSLAGALWAASGYVAAFMRASNAIYDVPEGRPIWLRLPLRIGLTVVVGVLLGLTALAVVLTGTIAGQVGDLLHLGSTVVTVWSIAKWPVLVMIVSLVFALMYWAAPNARSGGFRWVSPGGLLAVLVWLVASAGFAVYVANFGKYNKTYGSLATIIIFLIWLWISNLAILLGAEFDAELERARAIAAGHRADDEPYLELRDTRKADHEHDSGLS